MTIRRAEGACQAALHNGPRRVAWVCRSAQMVSKKRRISSITGPGSAFRLRPWRRPRRSRVPKHGEPSVAVAAEAESGRVVDALFRLELEDHSLPLAEHEKDASFEASGAEVDGLPVVVANNYAHFSGWIVDLDDTLHGTEV